jgi:hypothetical protein
LTPGRILIGMSVPMPDRALDEGVAPPRGRALIVLDRDDDSGGALVAPLALSGSLDSRLVEELRTALSVASPRTDIQPTWRADLVLTTHLGSTPRTVEVTLSGTPGEPAAALIGAFQRIVISDRGLIEEMSTDEATDLGSKAATDIVASLRWARVVGDRIDTSDVVALLGVTRQALEKRRRSGSVLGLPGRSTTWYPVWQFDLTERRIRPEVREVVGAFRDRLDDHFDPVTVAAWATTDQPEDLDGETPAAWLVRGGDRGRLVRSAEHTAARLAR